MGKQERIIRRMYKSRLDLMARQHALRPCEPERKVENMFSRKTFYELFLEGEQRANLIKLCMQSLGGKEWGSKAS